MASSTELTHLQELFEAHARGLPGVSRRKMFGCEGFFREGNIFGLIWKEGRIGIKLPEGASFDEAMAMRGAAPWKAGAMAMKHWVLVPESFHDDEEALGRWIRKAHEQAGAPVAKGRSSVAKATKPAARKAKSAPAKRKNATAPRSAKKR